MITADTRIEQRNRMIKFVVEKRGQLTYSCPNAQNVMIELQRLFPNYIMQVTADRIFIRKE